MADKAPLISMSHPEHKPPPIPSAMALCRIERADRISYNNSIHWYDWKHKAAFLHTGYWWLYCSATFRFDRCFSTKTCSNVFRLEYGTVSRPFCPFCLTEGTAGSVETFPPHQPFLLAAICNQIVSMSTQSAGLPWVPLSQAWAAFSTSSGCPLTTPSHSARIV